MKRRSRIGVLHTLHILRMLGTLGSGCFVSLGCHSTPRAENVANLERAPVELSLRTSTGRELELGERRGAPVLVAFLGTYDTVSQAALEAIARYARHHEDVFVVAILAQQGAEMLVEPYAIAADVDFPIAYDPSEALLRGETGFGVIGTVPSFATLDANGRLASQHVGHASERQLDILVERARLQAPVNEAGPPPLLGRPR